MMRKKRTGHYSKFRNDFTCPVCQFHHPNYTGVKIGSWHYGVKLVNPEALFVAIISSNSRYPMPIFDAW